MKVLKLGLTYLFAAFMIYGGTNHFLKPDMYFPFIPNFMPQVVVNYTAGIVEIVLGIGACFSLSRSVATLGILLLMLVFLPLHIIDVFKEIPAIGSHQAAMIRLPVQFIFILWAWFIYKK